MKGLLLEGKGRRDVIIILILMIIIAAVIVSWLSGLWSCEAKRQDLTAEEKLSIADYINSISVLVQHSNKLSLNYFTTLNKFKDLSSDELDSNLSQVIEESRVLYENSNEINPPQNFEVSHGYLNLVFQVRNKAYENFKPALYNVLQELDYDKSLKQLKDSFLNMYMSDKIYSYFQDELKKSGEKTGIGNLTIIDSKILEDENLVSESSISSMIADFKSVTNLQERRGVAIIAQSINFSPQIINEQDEYLIIKKGTQINISINVENQGNVSEQKVLVRLTYTVQGNSSAEKIEQTIDLMNPSEQKTVTFMGVRAYPGKKCEITIEAGPVENEALTSNNSATFKFMMES
jgi:hypothetical protein